MVNYERLSSKRNTTTVNTYITDLKSKKAMKVNLSPKYQRDDVWSTRQQSEYVQSVMHNTAPHNIILNYDKKNKEKVCMDGKQRSTAILNYYDNMYPIELEGCAVYHNELPKDDEKKDDDTDRVMTEDEEAVFLNRELGIIEYQDLTYDNQSSLFYKLQNGTKLSSGEKVIALLKGEKNAVIMNNFCKSYELQMKRFVDITRKAHYVVIIQYLYTVAESKLVTGATKVNTHFKKLEINDTLENDLENIKSSLDYTLAIFNSAVVPRMNQKLFFTLLYAFNQNYAKLKQRKMDTVIAFLKSYCKKISDDKIDMTQKKEVVMEELYKIFKVHIKMLSKKAEIIDEDEDENNDDDNDEDDNDDDNDEDDNDDDDNDEDDNDDNDEDDNDDNDDNNEDNENYNADDNDDGHNTESDDDNDDGHNTESDDDGDDNDNDNEEDEVIHIPIKDNKIVKSAVKNINKTNGKKKKSNETNGKKKSNETNGKKKSNEINGKKKSNEINGKKKNASSRSNGK